MKTYLLLVAFCLTYVGVLSQFSGGHQAGQQIPSAAEKASVGAGPVSGNVDVFNGTLNASYDFGTISTLSGLSYPVRLVYNSQELSSFDMQQNSGIPYGEGWSLANASITVETMGFKYKAGDLGKQSLNGKSVEAYTPSQAMNVGRLYFTNPFLKLPGGVSGRLVYKYPDPDAGDPTAVYVLSGFSSYVEARFEGHQWIVRMDDGTEYIFATPQKTIRNPVALNAHQDSDVMFDHSAFPRTDIVKWHLTEIRHPNHSIGQRIVFSYEGFGKIHMHGAFKQKLVADELGSFTSPFESKPQDFDAHREIFLTTIYSADNWGMEYQRVDFKHRSWRTKKQLTGQPLKYARGKFLALDDPTVSRIDSLYSRKTIWFQGEDVWYPNKPRPALADVPFGKKWRRYMHLGAYQNPLSNHLLSMEADDPYTGTFDGLGAIGGQFVPTNKPLRAHSEALKANGLKIPFTHSILESERINPEDMPSGDLYELKAAIQFPAFADMNFDVSLVSGQHPGQTEIGKKNVDGIDFTFENALSIASGSSGQPTFQGYDKRGYRFFSTFDNAVKWNPVFSAGGNGNPGDMITSDVFRMPNLPNSFEGFHVQVGPAADDLNYAVDGLDSSAYPFYYSNRIDIGKPGPWVDNVAARRTRWFGSGAPFHGIFIEGRLGMGKRNGWKKGHENGSKFFLFRHYPVVNPYRGGSVAYYKLKAFGPNQPTSVTRELTNFGYNSTSAASYHSQLGYGHSSPEESFLKNIELVRISKNPYMLDSVIFSVRNGNFDSTGRVRTLVFKLDYELEQTKVLNGAAPGFVDPPHVLPQDTFKIINGNVQYRNIWHLSSIRRVGVDTTGSIAKNAPQTFTRFNYVKDLVATPYVYEGNLLLEIWDELGGRTQFVYDFNSKDSIPVGLAGNLMTTPDYSGKVLAGLKSVQQKFPVLHEKVEAENGWLETTYSYGNSIVLDRELLKDWHFINPYNSGGGKNYTWGYDSVTVAQPSIGGAGQAKSVYHYHEKSNSIAERLLFGKTKLVRAYDELGNRIAETKTRYYAAQAYWSGWKFPHDELELPSYSAIEIGNSSIYPAAKSYGYGMQKDRYDSWFVVPKETISIEYDTASNYRIVDTIKYTYYDKSIKGIDTEGDYGNVYLTPTGDNYFKSVDYGFGGEYFNPLDSTFRYPFEPSWQVASETHTSPDMPCAEKRTEHFYLWDSPFHIEEFLDFKSVAGSDSLRNVEHSFRPYYFARKYGMRNVPLEIRTKTDFGKGNSANGPHEISTYYWYKVFEDVEPDFQFTTDSGNYVHFQGGQKLQVADTGSGVYPVPMIPNMINITGNQFYLKTVHQQFVPEKYFDVDYPGKTIHNVLRPKYDQWHPYGVYMEFDPIFPVVKTYEVLERDMYGQILEEQDIRGTRFEYSYPIGQWHTAWDSTGKKVFSVIRKTPGMPDSVTVTAGKSLKHLSTFKYNRNLSLFELRDAAGDTTRSLYDNYGRLSKAYQKDHKLGEYSYGTWGGNTAFLFKDRTKQNFVIGFSFDGMNPGNPLISTAFVDPLGRNAQSFTSILENGGQYRRRYEGLAEYDDWNRLQKKHMPTSKLASDYFLFDAAVAQTDFTEIEYENDLRSREIKSAGPTRSINGNKASRNEFRFITLWDFRGETGVSNSEILANFPCLSISNTGPTAGTGTGSTNLPGGTTGPTAGNGTGTYAGTGSPSVGTGTGQIDPDIVLKTVRIRKAVYVDEDGNQKWKYTDAFGRVIGEMAFDSLPNNPSSRVLTQYQHDDHGNVDVIVHPNKLKTKSKYNFLGWPYAVETPDAGLKQSVYLPTGEVKLFQDENLRQQSRVLINHYDGLGRMYEVNTDFQTSISSGLGILFDSASWGGKGFRDGLSIFDFPELKEKNSSDDRMNSAQEFIFPVLKYTATSPKLISQRRHEYGINLNSASIPWLVDWPSNVDQALADFGKTTQKTRATCDIVYNAAGLPSEFTFYNYDRYGHIDKVGKQFNPDGITSSDQGISSIIEYEDLDYSGRPWTVNVDLNADGILDFQHHLRYDAIGQLKTVWFNRLNLKENGTKVASFNYDPATGLPLEKVHYAASSCGATIPIDTTTYFFDQMNRLTGMYSKTFQFDLYYDNENVNQLISGFYPGGEVSHDSSWNGNIIGWQAKYTLDSVPGFDHPSLYGFHYDGLSRLTMADGSVLENTMPLSTSKSPNGFNPSPIFGQQITQSNAAYMGDVHYRYDKAGNIMNLMRYYFYDQSNGSPVHIGDNWNYTYWPNSNKLIKLGTYGMPKIQLSYDQNGNLATDSKRGLWGFKYNIGNLPDEYINGKGERVKYGYGLAEHRVYKEIQMPTLDTGRVYYLRDANGQVLATLDSEKKGWEVPIYGNGMIAEAFISDSTTGDSITQQASSIVSQQKIQRRHRRRKTLKILKNIVVAAAPIAVGAFHQRIEGQPDLTAPVAVTVAPLLMHYTDKLIDRLFEKGDLKWGNPESIMEQDTTADSIVTGLKYVIVDHLGNTRVTYVPVFDSLSGPNDCSPSLQIHAAIDYFPYGKHLRSWFRSDEERWQTTRHERDDESGLDYRGARLYDADYARFSSVDPLAIQFDKWSPYNYVLGRPTVLTDPDGRCPSCIIFFLGGMEYATNDPEVQQLRKDLRETLTAIRSEYKDDGTWWDNATTFMGNAAKSGWNATVVAAVDGILTPPSEILKNQWETGTMPYRWMKRQLAMSKEERKEYWRNVLTDPESYEQLAALVPGIVLSKKFGVRKAKQGPIFSAKASDFISEHAFKRHSFDASRVSTGSRTMYGKFADVKAIRKETINSADEIVKNYDAAGNHYSTTYKKKFSYNISTKDTPTKQSRVIINHKDPSRSTQFPYLRKQ